MKAFCFLIIENIKKLQRVFRQSCKCQTCSFFVFGLEIIVGPTPPIQSISICNKALWLFRLPSLSEQKIFYTPNNNSSHMRVHEIFYLGSYITFVSVQKSWHYSNTWQGRHVRSYIWYIILCQSLCSPWFDHIYSEWPCLIFLKW